MSFGISMDKAALEHVICEQFLLPLVIQPINCSTIIIIIIIIHHPVLVQYAI
jgi:hypothetical protein